MQSKRHDAIHLCVGRVCASINYYSHDPNFHLNIMYLTFPTSHLHSLAIKLITNIEIINICTWIYIYIEIDSFSSTFFNSLKTLKIFSSFSLSSISTWRSNSNSSHQFLCCRVSAFKLAIRKNTQTNKRTGFILEVLLKLYDPLTTFSQNDFHFLLYFCSKNIPFTSFRKTINPFTTSWACFTNEFALILLLTFPRALKPSSHFKIEDKKSWVYQS